MKRQRADSRSCGLPAVPAARSRPPSAWLPRPDPLARRLARPPAASPCALEGWSNAGWRRAARCPLARLSSRSARPCACGAAGGAPGTASRTGSTPPAFVWGRRA
eukprot:321507-Chlamydomonas_euryale.AAC.4